MEISHHQFERDEKGLKGDKSLYVYAYESLQIEYTAVIRFGLLFQEHASEWHIT